MRDRFYSSIPFRKKPTGAHKPISISNDGATGYAPIKTKSSEPFVDPEAPVSPPMLTNPDMILPHKEQESSVSMSLWSSDSNDLQLASNDITISSDLGLILTRTPFVYGAGTSLSDIGEVTEAENTPRRTKPVSDEKKVTKQSQNVSSGRLSQTNGSEITKKWVDFGSHRKRISDKSTNSIASTEQSNFVFKDFEDDLSVDDSVFQGDDEESVIGSDSEDTIAPGKRVSWKDWNKYDHDENSSIALSRKAEQILLNAKRRLNSMEDNLNRARTSINQRQSSSVSSTHSISSLTRSTPSPSQSEGQRSQLSDSIYSRNKPRDTLSRPTSDVSFEPRRFSDKSSSQSPLVESLPSASIQSQPRSKSGSPSSTCSSEHTGKDRKESPSLLRSLRKNSSPIPPELLNENGVNSHSSTHQEFNNHISEKYANQLGDIRVLTRSASSLQMRDIENQVQGLKGRLSRLRNRARDDSVRRRSLQFFKTPTPFTDDENLQDEDKNYLNSESISVESNVSQPYSTIKHASSKDTLGLDLSLSSEGHNSQSVINSAQKSDSDKSLSGGTNEVVYKDVEVDLENKCDPGHLLGRSTEDSQSNTTLYYNTTISHEDREDAFDYEHFFLHSALGTIGHERRDSFTSEESVETTRGFSTTCSQRLHLLEDSGIHLRSISTDTLSTTATFETAIEGLDDAYDDIENNNFAVSGLHSSKYHPGLERFSSQPTITTTATTTASKNPNMERINSYGYTNYDVTRKSSNRSLYNSHTSLGQRGGSGFSIVTDMSKRKSYKASFSLYDTTFGSDQTFLRELTKSGSTNLRLTSLHAAAAAAKVRDTKSPANQHNNLFSEDLFSSDDLFLIRRLLSGLGECVLGLQEAGRESDLHLWRGRLDAARKVLDGDKVAV